MSDLQPAYDDGQARIYLGDALTVLREMPSESVHCVVTSPPYWGLRDYGVSDQIGLEATPDEFVAQLVGVFDEVRRVLRPEGTLWLNIGDSYLTRPYGDRHTFDPAYNGRVRASGYPNRSGDLPEGMKPKDMAGIPWSVAFALRSAGWYLRQDIVWAKPNPIPESIADRCTKSHEYIFLLTKSPRYFFDGFAIREPSSSTRSGSYADFRRDSKEALVPGAHNTSHRVDREPTQNTGARNKRDVWTVATEPNGEAHFATFPEALIEPCILAGTSEHGCCSSCGASWSRDVEIVDHAGVLGASYHNHHDDLGRGQRGVPALATAPERRTKGWNPTCEHEAPTVPCTVLDPFMGSGTTAAVSKRLGRRAVGIELNPEYIEMASRRVSQMGLFAS